MKYFEGTPVIRDMKRVSKPGRRVYSKIKDLPRVYNGLGSSSRSTPQGGRADSEANGESPVAEPERRRYILDAEREKRQQLWRWLVFGAIVVVFLEMLMAGRNAQRREPEAV